jgi:hypothetical protein
MVLEAVFIALMVLGQAPRATSGDTAKVALLQQNIATVEAAARGAKAKSGDAQALATIEKKYADTAEWAPERDRCIRRVKGGDSVSRRRAGAGRKRRADEKAPWRHAGVTPLERG